MSTSFGEPPLPHVPDPGDDEHARPEMSPKTKRTIAAVVASLVLGAVALVCITDRNNTREHEADIAARASAAQQCVEAVTGGEQAFSSGTAAVATLAGAVVDAGDTPNTRAVKVAAAAVKAAQDPARAALAECTGSSDAPVECTHSASVLQQAADRQEAQAVTLQQIAKSAAAHDQGTLDVHLAQLSQQRTELEQLVTTVNDTACSAAAGMTQGDTLPDLPTQ